MKRSKRVISFLLSLLMVMSVLPISAYAEETTNHYTISENGTNYAWQRKYFAGDPASVAPKNDGVVGANEYSIASITDISNVTTSWERVYSAADNSWVSANSSTTEVGVYVSYDTEYICLAATSTVKEDVDRNSNEIVEFAIGITDDTNEILDVVVTQSGGVRNVYKQYKSDSSVWGATEVTDYSGFIMGSAATLNETTNTLSYELKLSRSGLAEYWNHEVQNQFLLRAQISTVTSEGTGTFFWMASNNSSTGMVGDYATYGGRIGHAIFLGKDSDFKNILGDSYSYCTEHSYSHYIACDENSCKQICACGTTNQVAHDYDTPVVTRPAGQVVDGEQTKACKNCSYVKTEVLPAVGATNTDNYGYNTYTMIGNNILQTELYQSGDTEANATRFTKLMEAYTVYNPDIICFQECDEGWHDLLDAEDGISTLGYASATTGFTSVDLRLIRNVIYYKTDIFEVVDAGHQHYSGYSYITDTNGKGNPWSFTWAVLASKESDERFVVSSTHAIWSKTGDSTGQDCAEERNNFAIEQMTKLKEISAEYNAPIVFMGDFNEVETGASYQTLAANFSNARKSAETVVNSEYGTSNTFGSAPILVSDGGKQIDHCFYSSGIEAIKYETVIEELSYTYSDHVPQRLYFKLDSGISYNFETAELTDLEGAGFVSSTSSSEDQSVSSQWSATTTGLKPISEEGCTLLNTPYTYENFRVSLDVYGGSKTGIVIGEKNTFETSGADTTVGIVFDNDQVELTGGIAPSTAEVSKSASWNPNNAPTYIYKPSSDFTFEEGKIYTLNVELYYGVLTVWVDGYSGSFSVQTADTLNIESIALVADASNNGLKTFYVEELGMIVRPYAADDFATYREDTSVAEDGNTYYISVPTYKGYTFSGWFYDKACTQSVANTMTLLESGTTVYAKFVSQYVLKVKAQISSHLQDEYWSNGDEQGAIRFVTTIDSKKYSKIGFLLNYTLDGEAKEKMVGSKYVYSTLYAEVGDKNSGQLAYKPNEEFCKSSAYFKSWTFTGVGEDYYDIDFYVTPYWITQDGTLVTGETTTKSVEHGIDVGYLSKKSALFLGDSAALGTSDEPDNDYWYTGWCGRLERKYGMTCENVAVDGAALAEYGVEKQLYNAKEQQYNFVVLEGGANDVLTDSATIQADLNSLIDTTKKKFPNAIVIYVINNAFGADADKMTAYVSAVKTACETYDITYVDLSDTTTYPELGELNALNLTADEYDLITPIIADHLRDVESHTRCICGLDENGEHFGDCDGTEVLWEAWTSTTSLPTTGNYYLANDVTVSGQTSVAGTLNLDLHGNTITETGDRVYAVISETESTLNITDLSSAQTGKITNAKQVANAMGRLFMIFNKGIVNLYRGTLDVSACATQGEKQGNVAWLNNTDAAFNMHGGTIKGNTNPTYDTTNYYALNIYVQSGTLKMTGGTIVGGRDKDAGIVYVATGGTFIMTEGIITGGTATGTSAGGNVYVAGTMTMTGGTIDGNVNWSGENNLTFGGNAIINSDATTGKGLTIPSGKSVAIDTFKEGASIAVNGEGGTIATDAEASDVNYIYLDESAGFGEVVFNEESRTLERTNTKTSCICGLDENGEHFGSCVGTELTWTEWTASTTAPSTDGNYCLTVDVNLTSQQTIYGNVNLDLNGHTITAANRLYNTFSQSDKCLNITDLSKAKNGSLASTATSVNGAVIYLSGTNCSVNIYAGILNGSMATSGNATTGCSLQLDTGTFNLYGGTIKGNSNQGNGLSVRVSDNATFNMSGGTITGGSSSEAGNVYMTGTMNMTGGTITGGTATSFETGGNIFVNGALNIYGGTVGDTTIYSATDVENESTIRSGGNANITYITP